MRHMNLEAEVSAETLKLLQRWSQDRRQSIGEIIEGLVNGTESLESLQIADVAKASFRPQKHLRESAVDLRRSALLFIDVQNFSCHRNGACYRGNPDSPDFEYWWSRMEEIQPRWSALQHICRKAGIEVMYTVMESLTRDGRDRSLDYKISGFHIPPKSFDAQVLACIRPGVDEMVIPKTSSSVFTTTNIDRILRNLDVKSLILAGVLSDQCVESAVRDACDLNYLVTLVTDACATYSKERHDNSCKVIRGYCRQRTVQELEIEIQELQKAAKP